MDNISIKRLRKGVKYEDVNLWAHESISYAKKSLYGVLQIQYLEASSGLKGQDTELCLDERLPKIKRVE